MIAEAEMDEEPEIGMRREGGGIGPVNREKGGGPFGVVPKEQHVEHTSDPTLQALSEVGFQLLDTVIHTWDVATALGARFVPDDETARVTLTLARLIPRGESRLGPTAAFAPVVDTSDPDPWTGALALTGRTV
jgi:hypothetical protein